MHDFDHKKLIERIAKLDTIPTRTEELAVWVEANAHMALIRDCAVSGDIIGYASGAYSFIHSIAVPNSNLSPLDVEDLMHWSMNPFQSIASYITGGGREGVWLERGPTSTGTKSLRDAVQLIFGRTFEGWTGPGRDYYELHQEYTHLAGTHWRPEKRAYCRFNREGDIEPVVSVTQRGDRGSDVSLVTFKRDVMEEYLAASDASLIQMFDFTLRRRGDFPGWGNGPEQLVRESDELFYRQKLVGYAGYTRGVQIIRPRRSNKEVHKGIVEGWFGREDKQYVEFIAHDWRNRCIARISTDPKATTNYFNTKDNSLPFELSPAFFRPDVILKYKTDREKYTVGEREISCRAAWHLTGIDVNEAGQVHAYICYLRDLPYSEQLHWLSYNEEPKASISSRAVTTDFEGQFSDLVEPLPDLLSIIRRWDTEKVSWWTLRDIHQMERVTTPLTTSRDEWAEAFMDLAKLVVEGFETKAIRVGLDAAGLAYSADDKTIALLEKLLTGSATPDESVTLVGLRTIQQIRSKIKGHASSEWANEFVQGVLMEYETFTKHFRVICEIVGAELKRIEAAFVPKAETSN